MEHAGNSSATRQQTACRCPTNNKYISFSGKYRMAGLPCTSNAQ